MRIDRGYGFRARGQEPAPRNDFACDSNLKIDELVVVANIMEATAEREGERAHRRRALSESPVERLCNLVCVGALIVMLGVIGVDIITRAVFNFSFEISDELGGYMLVAITFVSLPVCQVHDSFHHVEFVQSRLSPRGRAISHIIFDILSLAFCAALLWQ